MVRKHIFKETPSGNGDGGKTEEPKVELPNDKKVKLSKLDAELEKLLNDTQAVEHILAGGPGASGPRLC